MQLYRLFSISEVTDTMQQETISFGARIRILRSRLNMTQRELANKMGVTPQAACKWENDQAYPDITSLYSLSRILNVSLDELFSPEGWDE